MSDFEAPTPAVSKRVESSTATGRSDVARIRTVGETLESVQHVHTSATRAILLQICQRLTRLEAHVSEGRDGVPQSRQEASQGSDTVRSEALASVRTMASKPKEYDNVTKVLQNDMRAHQNHLSVLSTTVENGYERAKVIDTKVNHHGQDVPNRFVELTPKLRDLPFQMATLEAGALTSRTEMSTFETNDETLSLQTHGHRLNTQRSRGFIDLQPFTIPDDRKGKVEARIRQQKASERHADAQAMINDAYASMAPEPVDLTAVEYHMERVSRVLSSNYSMQIFALLGGTSDKFESCRFPFAISARAAAGD